MKDNGTGLTSRIIAKEYRNGKKIMTIVVDYADELGKRKQKSKGTGMTFEQWQRDGKKKVEVMRQEFVNQVYREQNFVDDQFFNPDKVTLFQFLENFQERRRNKVSATHWLNGEYYNSQLKKYLCQKDMLLKRFTHKTLLAFYDKESNRKMANGQTISTSTLAHIVTYFTTAFRDAWKNDLTTYDLTKYTDKPKVISRREKRFLQEQDYIKFLTFPNQDRRDAIVKLDVLLGLRRSEILGLRYSDIDPSANTILIRRKVLYYKKPIESIPETEWKYDFEISNEMKTASSKRIISLNELMWEQINWLKETAKNNKERLLNLYHDEQFGHNDFICVDDFGELYKPNSLTDYMIDLCKKLDIPYCNFHGLRSTCATILSLTGASMKEAQEHLGHSNIGTTMDTYTHLFQSQRQGVADRVTQYVKNKRYGQN